MRKIYLMSIILLFAALTMGITPALAAHDNGKEDRQENSKRHGHGNHNNHNGGGNHHGDGQDGNHHGGGHHDGNNNGGNNHHDNGEGHHHGNGHHGHGKHHHEGAVVGMGVLLLVLSDAEQNHETRATINRTADVLIEAQKIARETDYNFGLGTALAYQEKAIFQLKKGRYEKAIYNSLWARAIAAHFIDDPEATENDEENWSNCDFRECELIYSYLTDKEARYMEGAPSPIEMRSHIDGIEISDDEVFDYTINSDI